MLRLTFGFTSRALTPTIRWIVFALAVLPAAYQGSAQDTPLISGGVGFFSQTNAGSTMYYPTIEPLLAAPLGQHVRGESRANLVEFFTPNGGDQSGYNHSHYIALTYLQTD